MGKRKIQVDKYFFYIFWTFLILFKGLGYTSENSDKGIFFIAIALFFALLKIISTKWSKKELIVSILLLFLGFVIFLSSKQFGALLLVVSLVTLKNINLEEVLKYTLFLFFILFFSKILLAIIGGIDKQPLIRNDRGNIHTIRYALGYGQPNVTQALYFIIVSLFIVVFKEKIKLWHYVIFILFDVLIFHYTNSRTGFLICILMIALSWILSKKWILPKRILLTLSTQSFNIGIVISIVICISYTWLMSKYNLDTFGARFYSARKIISSIPISLFGKSGVLTDLSYVGILYEKGVVFFSLFYASLYRLLKKLKMENDVFFSAFLLSLSVYMLNESYFDSISMNPFLIYLSIFIFDNRINDKRIEDDMRNSNESFVSK